VVVVDLELERSARSECDSIAGRRQAHHPMSEIPLLTGTEPFSADGGRVGVVVSHGFTGSPASMRPWAVHLANAGYSVRLPLLPGHGTSWEDLNTRKWREWYASIEQTYAELAWKCDQVFAVGLSMGGCLVTKLAIDNPEIAGLVLVNPAFAIARRDAKLAPYVSRLIRSQKGKGVGSDIKAGGIADGYDRTPLRAFVEVQRLWATVVPQLPELTVPVRLYTSRVDHVVDPLSVDVLRAKATQTTIEQIWLEDSYHVATLDNDRQTIFDGSVEFIAAHTAAGSVEA
jgi:carboxylesterase